MRVNLSDKALEHIQKKGGQAAIDLFCLSS